jgi:hypothetical protein
MPYLAGEFLVCKYGDDRDPANKAEIFQRLDVFEDNLRKISTARRCER